MEQASRTQSVDHGAQFITDFDSGLFKQGTHLQIYEKLGAHALTVDGKAGTHFAVWAPNARNVSVVGDFNGWNKGTHPLTARWDSSGIWEGFIPGISRGALYKYHIVSQHHNYAVTKRDPCAFYNEIPPQTSSIVWDLEYAWQDAAWMSSRHQRNSLEAPISIYEVHLGSWRRVVEENARSLSYKELAHQLAGYVKDMGFTHVEFLPVMEHPFYGSWGYQTLGYFAPTARYGTPQDFMYLIDCLHQNGIGVILDWVPSHFPSDEHGLVYFDGTHLYEHADPREGFHPDWKSYIFNHGRREIGEFLLSSALFWLKEYHADGLRVDAVASMLYRDYSRSEGEWIPNQYGGRENIEAIAFLKRLNETVYQYFPDVQMFAEESTSWAGVSRPVFSGGLGFGMKWNMGWMHDTLVYFSKDPIYRKYHHHELTFSFLYVFSENFLLSLSHDEVVHGKGSLLRRMPGDEWQRFANLRLLLGYMFAHPGKKLLFMGAEFAQWREWYHEQSLDWHLLEHPLHQGMLRWVRDLNMFYQQEKSLFEIDFHQEGFQWIDPHNYLQSVLIFIRQGRDPQEKLLVVCNFTPMTYSNFRVGVPYAGEWQEVLASDARAYGGSGQENAGLKSTAAGTAHGQPQFLSLTIPPLGISFFKRRG